MSNEINFNTLISSIHEIDKNFVLQSKRAININLTLRNWFIGAYIYEYELNGCDRAEYGDRLLFHIEKKLENLSNCNRRQLYEYIQFYKVYPQIVGTVSAQLESPIFSEINAIFEKVPTVSAQSLSYTKSLLSKLSYSMFKLLIGLSDSNKRMFYELEAVMDQNGYPVLQYVWDKFWVNNHAHVLQGANDFSTEMLYLLFKNTKIAGIVNGAVQLKINQTNLMNLEVLIPDQETLKQFDEAIQPIFAKIRDNSEQIQSLARSRDELLPKLMSGEVRVNF